MKNKGVGQKGFVLVIFAIFISTGVFGEGKNVDGYNQAGARIDFFNTESSDSDSYASESQSIENTKPPLAMTTALKFEELLSAYLRFSMASEKGVASYVAPNVTSNVTPKNIVTSVTAATQWTRSDLEVTAGNKSHSEGDLSYGIDADFILAEDAKINTDYLDIVDGSEVDMSGFSFGTSWTF